MARNPFPLNTLGVLSILIQIKKSWCHGNKSVYSDKKSYTTNTPSICSSRTDYNNCSSSSNRSVPYSHATRQSLYRQPSFEKHLNRLKYKVASTLSPSRLSHRTINTKKQNKTNSQTQHIDTLKKYNDTIPNPLPSFPTEYTSKEWQCAITSNFSGSVPHMPPSMFTIPDNPEELEKTNSNHLVP